MSSFGTLNVLELTLNKQDLVALSPKLINLFNLIALFDTIMT